ncbi:MAG TPA: RnfABCDGE type electron transport complex subunit B [Candidatus Fimadaptatus faecigallinarum]|uniref:Ion-translocating oxidoreductase complex subunit B n=1 Tax=Candidatus Fimadaptatus faecigallinarum TaxID=2840814 RepID=A0A9D1S4K1_9FIRM|nr:RnfABCDGE type electron transport complex subunit B [Candidatus Fimadaptatus faecigallinarum]
MQILIAAGILGALGLVFGGIIFIASKYLSVPTDPKRDEVRACLPGANCGGCGFAGCDNYADAVASGKAAPNLCPVGGEPVAKQIAEIMGVDAGDSERLVATVICRGSTERCRIKFDYDGIKDCRAAALVSEGDKACKYACLGLGACEQACPFGAIHINDQRLAVVDPDKCRGCRKCVSVCPRGVLQMLPVNYPVMRVCSAMEKGKAVRDACSAGCISCGKCARGCKFGAIEMKDNLPQIDHEKCVGCMNCADECPTGAIRANESLRRMALLHVNKCDGCDECRKACPFEAIQGEPGQMHNVITWNCKGCGKCVPACPNGALELIPTVKHSKN